MKTCVACKYVTRIPGTKELHCGNSAAIVSVNLVDGARTITSCADMRVIDECGKDGLLFEAGNSTGTITVFERLREWFVS